MAVWDSLLNMVTPGSSRPAPPSVSGAGTGGTGTAGGPAVPPPASPSLANLSRQTKKVMTALLIIAGAGLALLAALALAQEKDGMHFLAWGAIAASCALVVGGALGLLFGLPNATATTVITTTSAAPPSSTPADGSGPAPTPESGASEAGRTGETPPTPPAAVPPTPAPPPPDSVDLGYRDSTSLEQVADWLTKIIIGLSLTQWDEWEGKFTNLATNLTVTLLGRPEGDTLPASLAVPGGVLLGMYGIIGFLVSYLWMRRFFILEMVTARREAREAMARQFEENQRRQKRQTAQAALATLIAAAQARGLAPTAGPTRAGPTPGATADQLRGSLRHGMGLLPPASTGTTVLNEMMEAVESSAQDPDDPWRGQFGGADSANGVTLAATVAVMSDPNTFRIELAVKAVTPARAQALNGTKALYFLHPTFGPDPRVSIFGSDGRAPLGLYAWGAFTVGVILEDGTRLELNLASLPGAPDSFRMR